MIVESLLFLAANTNRSNAYIQAMARRGLNPSHTIIFGSPSNGAHINLSQLNNIEADVEVPLPDLSRSLVEESIAISKRCDVLDASSVNDSVLVEAVRESVSLGNRLVLYSGFGGQLVGPELLSLNANFLHAHSGWLPDYRGSTTIYYSLLDGNECGVSVILLSSHIDQGPIVSRRLYRPPPPGIDIDHIYDSAIRADLITDVIVDWVLNSGVFPNLETQNIVEGNYYYVIHPILKHISILMINE